MDLNKLATRFPNLAFLGNVSLANYTYMKVGGAAKLLVVVTSGDDLFSLGAFCFQEKIPFLVLGGGSNVIIADRGIEKLVIINKTQDIDFGPIRDGVCKVTALSGVTTALLANQTMERGLSGLEYYVGVPGSIGGAIVNNSHFTAKQLIGSLVTSVTVCTKEGKKETWDVDKLKFDYDYSVFHELRAIVLSATFSLIESDPQAIRDLVLKVAGRRASTQPIGLPSSGCMYKNPQISNSKFQILRKTLTIPEGAYHLREDGNVQVAAGLLIDRADLKGMRVGGVEVSTKHATYMVNVGGATANDIETLCRKVEMTVMEKFGIKLEREVFFIQ